MFHDVKLKPKTQCLRLLRCMRMKEYLLQICSNLNSKISTHHINPQTFWPPSIRIRSIPKRHSEKSCKESIKEQTQKLDLEKENFDDMKVKLDASEVAKEHLSSKLKEMEVGTIDVVVENPCWVKGKQKGLLRYVTLKERKLLKGLKVVIVLT